MNRSDRAIRVLTAFAVLVVAAIAAVISFTHIDHLAITHGQTVLSAALLPLSIDGTVAAASLVMLRSARMMLPVPKLARVMLALAVLATLACNVLFGAGFGIVGALLSGWPAVAFIGCAELAIGMIRRARSVAPEVVAEAMADVADDVPVGAPIPMPVQSIEAVSAVTPGPVADNVPDDANIQQARSAGRTVARRHTRRHTPQQRAERKYAAHVAAGQVPSLRALMRDLGVGQDRAREVRQHLASLATANGTVNHG